MDLCPNSDKAKFGLKEISEQESESDSGGSESDSDTSDPGSVISKDHKNEVKSTRSINLCIYKSKVSLRITRIMEIQNNKKLWLQQGQTLFANK